MIAPTPTSSRKSATPGAAEMTCSTADAVETATVMM